MDISIIIVNYNTRNLLNNCLSSIYKFTNSISFEIIVVDNNSIDNSDLMVADKFPKVNFIKLSKNVGFGKANNIGVEGAKGKYLLFLNSDTRLCNNAPKIFFDFIETQKDIEKIGVIGALLIDENSRIIHSYRNFPRYKSDLLFQIKINLVDLLGKRILNIVNILKKKVTQTNFDNKKYFAVDYVTGADMFVSKELFLGFGGFDKRFFMYFEESDLQYHFRKAGHENLIIDGPEIIHLEGASFNETKHKSNNKRILFDVSHILYYKKNFNKVVYFLFRISFFIIQIMTILNLRYTRKEHYQYFKAIMKPY